MPGVAGARFRLPFTVAMVLVVISYVVSQWVIELQLDRADRYYEKRDVSRPVGLPSFFKLTKRVIKRLGVSPSSKVGELMARAIAQNDPDLAPPLDQVFGLLQREYSRSRVEREVNRELKNPIGANPADHEAVLRLIVRYRAVVHEIIDRNVRTFRRPPVRADVGLAQYG